MNDLTLFTWKPATCVVLAFPHSRRVGKIRRVAEVMARKTELGSARYWSTTAESLQSQMIKAGIPPATIKFELQSFQDAVQRELNRLMAKGKSA